MTTPRDPVALARDARAGITRALEALHDGDPRFAVQILEGLVDDLADFLGPVASRSCSRCGLLARWPGELADHLRRVHGEAA